MADWPITNLFASNNPSQGLQMLTDGPVISIFTIRTVEYPAKQGRPGERRKKMKDRTPKIDIDHYVRADASICRSATATLVVEIKDLQVGDDGSVTFSHEFRSGRAANETELVRMFTRWVEDLAIQARAQQMGEAKAA